MLAFMLDYRSGNTYPIVGLAAAYDVVVKGNTSEVAPTMGNG
jgi:hypothetical protein